MTGVLRRAALVAVMAAAACGGGAGGGPAADAPRSDLAPAGRDQVRDGGELRRAISHVPATFNFFHADGGDAQAHDAVTYLTQPHAGRETADGEVVNDPDYVTEWDVQPEGAGQVVTLRLNPEARWSDGRRLSAEDFAAMARTVGRKPDGFEVGSVEGFEFVDRVERGSGENEVKIYYTKRYADWKAQFVNPMVPASVMRDRDEFNTGWKDAPKVTGGPFKWGGFDKTRKVITLLKDPAWWGDEPKLDKITISVIEQDAQIGAVANQELDLAERVSGAANVARAKEVPHAELRMAAAPDWRQLTINATSEIMKDRKVRQAVTVGLDRAAIARADLVGHDFPVLLNNNHFYVPTQEGYEDTSGEFGRHDPERAGRLLDEAGWRRDGAGFRSRNGRPLEVDFVVPSGAEIGKTEGELAQAMLREIGVKVNVRVVKSDDFFSKVLDRGEYDIAPFSWIGTTNPWGGSTTFRTLEDPNMEAGVGNNFARNGSKEIDKLLDQAIVSGPKGYTARLNEASRRLWALGHTIPLFQRPQITVVDKNLVNIGPGGFSQPDWTKVGWRKNPPA